MLITKNKELWLMLAVCILLMFIRSPQLFLDARFWAEEGTYFSNAYTNGVTSLWYVYPKCGYYYLFANFAAYIATLFPLWIAPYVTTWFAFSIQIITIVAILFLPSYLFTTNRSRMWISLFIVLNPCVVSEVWLNTVNSQVFFGIIAVCILFTDWTTTNKETKTIWLVCLGVAAFSGVYSCILAPFFTIKYFLVKRKENLLSMIITIVAFITQSIIAITMKVLNQMGSRRQFDLYFTKDRVFGVLRHQIVRPLLGYDNAKKTVVAEWVVLLITIIVLIIALTAIVIAKEKLYLVMCLIILPYYMLFTAITALGEPGGRYAVVSGIILMILLVSCIETFINKINNKYLNMVLGVIMATPLLFGCIDFQGSKNAYLTTEGQVSWKDQISILKNAEIGVEGREIKIWPSGWYIILESEKE